MQQLSNKTNLELDLARLTAAFADFGLKFGYHTNGDRDEHQISIANFPLFLGVLPEEMSTPPNSFKILSIPAKDSPISNSFAVKTQEYRERLKNGQEQPRPTDYSDLVQTLRNADAGIYATVGFNITINLYPSVLYDTVGKSEMKVKTLYSVIGHCHRQEIPNWARCEKKDDQPPLRRNGDVTWLRRFTHQRRAMNSVQPNVDFTALVEKKVKWLLDNVKSNIDLWYWNL